MNVNSINYFKRVALVFACLTLSKVAIAECSDFDAKIAADKSAQDHLGGTVFKSALVLKRHLPSKRKEVASYVYVKADDLYYTVYTLVNTRCEPQFIKRTYGKH